MLARQCMMRFSNSFRKLNVYLIVSRLRGRARNQGWEFIKEKRKHARKHARKQEKIQVVLIGRIDKLLKVVESKID